MFGLEYILAFMKIMINIGFAIVTAIPMYYSWNCIAPKYFSTYIPQQFLILPFWHIVAIFLICTYVGEQIEKLTPKFISVKQSVNDK